MKENRLESLWRYRWLIFSILASAYFIVYFHRLSLSVVADDLVREFQATASAMGLLGSIYFYCYAIMQLPTGLFADSVGPRKTVTFSLLIAATGSILFGMAPNMPIAFLGRVLVGLGVSMVFVPTLKILSQWFRAREFALMSGILNAVGGVGVLAATWFLALMTGIFGWRMSFILIGVITFMLTAMVWIIVRNQPEEKGWPSIIKMENNKATTETSVEEIPLLAGMRRVVSEKYFWPVALWFFLDLGIFFGFGGLWSGPYLMHAYEMTQAEAGSILSMIAWGMIVGSPLLGYVSDRVLKSRKKVFIICNSILVGILILLYLFPAGLPRASLYFIFLIFSITSSAIVVMGFTTIKELFPVEIAGTSIGTINLFPFLGGAVYMPILGRILDAYPKSSEGAYSIKAYSVLLLILLATSVASLICTFLMKETFSGTR